MISMLSEHYGIYANRRRSIASRLKALAWSFIPLGQGCETLSRQKTYQARRSERVIRFTGMQRRVVPISARTMAPIKEGTLCSSSAVACTGLPRPGSTW